MQKITQQALNWLTLQQINRIGPKSIGALAKAGIDFSQPLDIFIESIKSNFALSKIYSLLDKNTVAVAYEKVLHEQELAQKHNYTFMCSLDTDYPMRLKAAKADPGIIFVKGNLPPPQTQCATVIGSRKPTEHSIIISAKVSEALSARKFSIISGLALGCDSEAHRAALRVHGHTVAVLAHGFSCIYPPENEPLAQDIVDNCGALVSTCMYEKEPAKWDFAQRDKIQAGLADFVLLIQSAVGGGSLIASGECLNNGRILAVIYPTEKDRIYNIKKVEANLILSSNDAKAKEILMPSIYSKLMRDKNTQELIRVIKSKNDYGAFTTYSYQRGLF